MDRDVSIGTLATGILFAMFVGGLITADARVLSALLALALDASIVLVCASGLVGLLIVAKAWREHASYYRKEARSVREPSSEMTANTNP